MSKKITRLVSVATAVGAAVFLVLAAPTVRATTIDGSLHFFGGGAIDGFDPTFGFVPSGYGNTSQSTAVAVGSGVEFGFFEPGRDLITADFTQNSLVIQDTCQQQSLCLAFLLVAQTFAFTASTPGFFDGLTKTGDTYVGGVTYTLAGDTLTVVWPDGDFSGTQAATFSFDGPKVSATPLPAALPLFASGFGLVGYLARRRKRKVASDAV